MDKVTEERAFARLQSLWRQLMLAAERCVELEFPEAEGVQKDVLIKAQLELWRAAAVNEREGI